MVQLFANVGYNLLTKTSMVLPWHVLQVFSLLEICVKQNELELTYIDF